MTEVEWLACDNPMAMLKLAISNVWPGLVPTGWRGLSDRKLRLFAVACWSAHPLTYSSVGWTEAIRQLEEVAEGNRQTFTRQAEGYVCATRDVPDMLRHLSGLWLGENNTADTRDRNARDAAAFLHDIAGNPFCAVACHDGDLPPTSGVYPPHPRECDCLVRPWRTPTVLSIAQAIYDERRWQELPVLADALEDAGASGPLLEHLRAACPYCKDADFSTNDLGVAWLSGPKTGKAIASLCVCGGSRRERHVRGCWALDLVLGKDQR